MLQSKINLSKCETICVPKFDDSLSGNPSRVFYRRMERQINDQLVSLLKKNIKIGLFSNFPTFQELW